MSIQEIESAEVSIIPAFAKDTGLMTQAAAINSGIADAYGLLEAFRDKIRGGKRLNVQPIRQENGSDGGLPGTFENSARKIGDLKKLISDLDAMF